MARVPTEREFSTGGVLYRPGAGGQVEVCLILTRNHSRWQLPKGHVDGGEQVADAAVREVQEETGCLGELGPEIGEITFWFSAGAGEERRRIKKTVRFYLLRYVQGETSDHDAEVDDARWFPALEAHERLTFASERGILKKALALIEPTRP